ncbi:high affinity copper uptake protein 1 [Plakobranchus ocellatus]|uniref:Copper transport protein n=1 Tax=Plakobranchus ocellatus TaxID=259542 RepID=A0AAV4ARS8_9GAST|nr:high affinity copper uptake protein 1 [Plakobranchus ocellatus]
MQMNAGYSVLNIQCDFLKECLDLVVVKAVSKMMKSYFNTAVHMTDVLFRGWDINSTKDAVLASFIALILTLFYECAKVIKAYIIIRRKQSPLAYGKHYTPQTPGSNLGNGDNSDASSSVASTTQLLSSLKIPVSIEQIRKWRVTLFVLESMMETFNFFLGYILMLLVMTYSIWFLVAVLIGSGIGYFFFTPVRQMYADKYSDDSHQAAINSNQPQEETTPLTRQTSNYESMSRN